MPRIHTAHLSCSRRELETIAKDPTISQHRIRAALRAVQKLQTQIATFAPWPALEASLQADIDALAARVDASAPQTNRYGVCK